MEPLEPHHFRIANDRGPKQANGRSDERRDSDRFVTLTRAWRRQREIVALSMLTAVLALSAACSSSDGKDATSTPPPVPTAFPQPTLDADNVTVPLKKRWSAPWVAVGAAPDGVTAYFTTVLNGLGPVNVNRTEPLVFDSLAGTMFVMLT